MRFPVCLITAVAIVGLARPSAAEVKISIDTPMAPPTWALLERELLRTLHRWLGERDVAWDMPDDVKALYGIDR